MRRNRLRVYALVAAVAIAGAAFAVLPALGDNHPDALRLHLGTDGQYFRYGDTTQTLTTNRCEVVERSGPLVNLAERRTGLDSLGLGYKSGGSQGTPCGRVSGSEILDISLHSDPLNSAATLTGRMFSGLRLDLELKGNAWITLELFADGAFVERFRLATGSSIATSGYPNPSDTNPDGGYTVTSDSSSRFVACASPSDSGPDSGANDNCQWTVIASQPFNQIKMTAQVGEFSLEGSGDYNNNPDYDTLFYLANTAPSAGPDSKTVGEDDAPTFIDVLANDSDPDDGDTELLEVTDVSPTVTNPSGGPVGTVTFDETGVTFDPGSAFNAMDDGETETNTFTYFIHDTKGGTASALVTVTITGDNDAPSLVTPVTVSEKASGEDAVRVVLTDPDTADQDQMTVNCVPTDPDLDGVVALTDSGLGDGTATYTTTDPYFFTDSTGIQMLCTYSDGNPPSDTGNIQLVVTGEPDAPIANPDVAEADNDIPVSIAVLANDSDPDGPSEALVLQSVDPTDLPAGFEAIIDPDSPNTVLFTGIAKWIGPVTFEYTVADSTGLTATTTVTVYEVVQCGESLDASEGLVTARYTRLTPTGESGCEFGKPYDLDILLPGVDDVDEPIVEFVPRQPQGAEDPVEATFSAELSFEPLTKVDGGADTGGIDYDIDSPGPEWDPMPWCVSSDVDVTVVDGQITEILVTEAVLPDGHTWCIAYKRTSPTEGPDEPEDKIRTIWTVYGIGDPFKRGS